MRITWFLLALSLLFDSIWSGDAQNDPSVTQKDTNATQVTVTATQLPTGSPTANKTDVTMAIKATNASTAAPTSDSTNRNVATTQKTTNTPQLTASTSGPPTAATAATAATKPTQNPKPTAVTTITLTLTPASTLPTSNVPSGVVLVTNVTSAASSVPGATLPASGSSSNITGLPTMPSTVKTPEPSEKTEILKVFTKLPADSSSNGVPVTAVVTTHFQTTQQHGGSNTFVSTTSPADNRAGTNETFSTSQGPTPFMTTMSVATPAPNVPTKQPGPVDTTVWTSPAQTTTFATTKSTTTSASPKTFIYSLLSEQETKEEEVLAKVCKLLMPNWLNGTCTLTWRHGKDKVEFDLVEISGKVKTNQAAQYYDELTKKPTDNRTLIAILASCGALLIMIVILAVCASHHRKPYHENQQHLTEELHTVENGYHDNPTLDVMEVQPEMQEKKVALNGEFNDSWIVPMDNLLKEDLPDEEDTHL